MFINPGYFCSREDHVILLVHIREGNGASVSPKNHVQVPYLADFSGLCVFLHGVSPGAVRWVRGAQCLPGSALLCTLSAPLCTVGMYLVTAASFPWHVNPHSGCSLVCVMVCAILIVATLLSLWPCVTWLRVLAAFSVTSFHSEHPQEGS